MTTNYFFEQLLVNRSAIDLQNVTKTSWHCFAQVIILTIFQKGLVWHD